MEKENSQNRNEEDFINIITTTTLEGIITNIDTTSSNTTTTTTTTTTTYVNLYMFDLLFSEHIKDSYKSYIHFILSNKKIIINDTTSKTKTRSSKTTPNSSKITTTIHNSKTNCKKNSLSKSNDPFEIEMFPISLRYSFDDRFTKEYYFLQVKDFISSKFYLSLKNSMMFSMIPIEFHDEIKEYFLEKEIHYELVISNPSMKHSTITSITKKNISIISTIKIFIKIPSLKDETNSNSISSSTSNTINGESNSNLLKYKLSFDKILYFSCSHCNSYHMFSQISDLFYFINSKRSLDRKNTISNLYMDTIYESQIDSEVGELYSCNNEDSSSSDERDQFNTFDDIIKNTNFSILPYKEISELQKYFILLSSIFCYVIKNCKGDDNQIIYFRFNE